MAVTLTINFDDTWAARLAPMVEDHLAMAANNHIIVELLGSLPSIDTVDDLTVKQKAVLLILFDLLGRLQRFEGDAAAIAARTTVTDDIAANFPLEVGNV